MKLDNYRFEAVKYGLSTLVAQLISFVSVPLISYFYQPAEYGHFVSFTASAAILLPFVTLKIESLISISEKSKDVQELKRVAITLTALMSLGISLLIFLVLIVLKNNILHSLAVSFLLGSIVQVQALSVILIQVKLKEQSFKKINISGILQNSNTLVFQIAFAIVQPSVISLQLGYISGRMIGLIPLLRKSNKFSVHNYSKEKFLTKAIVNIFVRSRYFIGASLVDALLAGIPILLLHKFYGQNFAGYFGMIQALYLVPVTLISSSFAAIAFSTVTNKDGLVKEERLWHRKQLIRSFAKPILCFAVIFLTISLTLAEPIMGLVISDKWSPMYAVIPAITLSSALNFIWFPFMNFLNLQGNSQVVFQAALARLIVGSIFALVAIQFNTSWSGMITIFLVSQLLFQILGLGAIYVKIFSSK